MPLVTFSMPCAINITEDEVEGLSLPNSIASHTAIHSIMNKHPKVRALHIRLIQDKIQGKENITQPVTWL